MDGNDGESRVESRESKGTDARPPDSRLATRDSRLALSRAAFLRRSAAGFAGTLLALPVLNGCAREEPAAKDDLDDLRRTDPALVKYREVARIETGFAEARGVAVGPGDTIYVAGDMEVRAFDAQGHRFAAYTMPAPPLCLAFGPKALYAGTPDGVMVALHGGPFRLAWEPIRPRALVTSLAVGRDAVYAANSADRIVLRYDLNGRLIGRIGEKDPARGYPGLIVPSPHLDVAVGRDGKVHVANPGMHRIETWTPDGTLKGTWGQEGSEVESFCGCCNPTDFALLPDGRFVTAEKGLARIKVYGAKGAFECVVAPPDAFAHDTFGIDLAVDGQGRVAALDPKTRTVRVYARA